MDFEFIKSISEAAIGASTAAIGACIGWWASNHVQAKKLNHEYMLKLRGEKATFYRNRVEDILVLLGDIRGCDVQFQHGISPSANSVVRESWEEDALKFSSKCAQLSVLLGACFPHLCVGYTCPTRGELKPRLWSELPSIILRFSGKEELVDYADLVPKYLEAVGDLRSLESGLLRVINKIDRFDFDPDSEEWEAHRVNASNLKAHYDRWERKNKGV